MGRSTFCLQSRTSMGQSLSNTPMKLSDPSTVRIPPTNCPLGRDSMGRLLSKIPLWHIERPITERSLNTAFCSLRSVPRVGPINCVVEHRCFRFCPTTPLTQQNPENQYAARWTEWNTNLSNVGSWVTWPITERNALNAFSSQHDIGSIGQ